MGESAGVIPGDLLGRVTCGDALGLLRRLPAESVDAVVTDPPAGIAFMGKEWDRAEGGRDQWVESLSEVLFDCLRVAKPGARLLCWAIPRTSHWTGTAIEDAGWIIEDRITHLFAQGFPKAKSKLKPAAEDWWLARKASARVPKLEIDACRIAAGDLDGAARAHNGATYEGVADGYKRPGASCYTHKTDWHPASAGRWPANVILSHAEGCEQVGTRRIKPNWTDPHSDGTGTGNGCTYRPVKPQGAVHADADGCETIEAWECVPDCPVALLDAQSGDRAAGYRRNPSFADSSDSVTGWNHGLRGERGFSDTGGASRFFYTPKASKGERGEGNTHPTVKPLALMRYLLRLVTPPGGLVLDPFAGSGTTLLAARAESLRAIGFERDEGYCEIARRRLAGGGLFAAEDAA